MTDQYTELRQALAALDAAPLMGNMMTREQQVALWSKRGAASAAVLIAAVNAAPSLLAERDRLREALQMATDALADGLWDYGPGQDEHDKCNEVIAHCREALKEQQ